MHIQTNWKTIIHKNVHIATLNDSVPKRIDAVKGEGHNKYLLTLVFNCSLLFMVFLKYFKLLISLFFKYLLDGIFTCGKDYCTVLYLLTLREILCSVCSVEDHKMLRLRTVSSYGLVLEVNCPQRFQGWEYAM